MSIVARELAVRSASVSLPDSPRFERKFLVSAPPGTTAQAAVDATGVSQWASHPEYPWAKAKSFSVAPGASRWHWEVTIGYELPQREGQDQHPLSRPDVWSFSTSMSQMPALFYYHGEGNGDIRPLVNSAGDLIEGLTCDVAELRASVQGNRATFNYGSAVFATNMTNASAYLGGGAHTWKCMGVSGQQVVEAYANSEIRYYQVTAELAYRADGWPLRIPNTGYHYIDANGEKLPCWVRDPESNGRRVRASQPVALDEQGGMLSPGTPPILLTRRTSAAGDFTSLFGVPTF